LHIVHLWVHELRFVRRSNISLHCGSTNTVLVLCLDALVAIGTIAIDFGGVDLFRNVKSIGQLTSPLHLDFTDDQEFLNFLIELLLLTVVIMLLALLLQDNVGAEVAIGGVTILLNQVRLFV
jgi:hypothetical protein